MAAVSISDFPNNLGTMSNRRVPLANVPNAANSPFRAVAAAATKRQRPQSTAAEESFNGELRPAKKQFIELKEPALLTPPRKPTYPAAEGRVFNKRSTNTQPTLFERKLLAAREAKAQSKAAIQAQEKGTAENYETIKQWQKHYRKVFPGFVFYFESVPDDVRIKCSRQLGGLGAREKKFFSRDVTHVITTRPVPVESESSTPTDATGHSSVVTGSHEYGQPRTINPSLLEKTSDSHNNSISQSKYGFDLATSRKLQPAGFNDSEVRKQQPGSADILHNAREMGMKIWQLEKLQRMMRVMYDAEWESPYQHSHNTRGNVTTAATTTKPGRDADLSRLLRNEQLNGASDRESAIATSELIPLKGPHIYIRDMNEKTKPIMVREYPKVQRREEGTWPQFRSVSHGKCPFVEEALHSRRNHAAEKSREQELLARAKADNQPSARSRIIASLESTKMNPPLHTTRKRPLAKTDDGNNVLARPIRDTQQLPLAVECDAPHQLAQENVQPRFKHLPAGISQRLYGGEPIASGVQPSNITSAIRSQMISSTAAAPGAKAGTSREVNGLQRKVLERNCGPSVNGISTTPRILEGADVTRTERGTTTSRVAKIKAQEKLEQSKLKHIKEDSTPSEEDENAKQASLKHGSLSKAEGKREPKPGYCENCRDKFEDFDEHVIGRKHRKFAVTQDNWKELDGLLVQLGRPLREDNIDEV